MPNQGGTHEQHVKAGQQSHKKDDPKKQASGQASSGGRDQDQGHRGGKGNFADDREKASDAGRKGGQH